MKRVICLIIVLASIMALFSGCCLSHEWQDATCTAPQTCAKCGKAEGEALGHKWKEATCTAAKTCNTCGETEGEALGHTWKDATCTSAQTCSVCYKKEGSPLDHSWIAATCTSPKKCSACKKTEGDPADHRYTWNTTKQATYTTKGEKKGTCQNCGNKITEEIEELVPEYHWNKPIQFGNLSIGMYKDSQNYWIEIKSSDYTSSFLAYLLRNSTSDFGFELQEFLDWYLHILESYNGGYVQNGIAYYTMEGYGRKWVAYFNSQDTTPGLIGLKVNLDYEFEAVVGIKVKD